MTLEETDLTEADLAEVRDRSLVENYTVHDVAEDYLIERLERAGYHVEPFGDDARHADEVFFGDGPDQRVFETGDADEHLCDIEVKAKRLEQGDEWFCRLNRRHYNEYVEHAQEQDQPVFVFFALVDEGEDCIVREAFVEIDGESIDGPVADVSEQVIAVDAADIEAPDAGSDSLRVIDASDVVGLERGKIVHGIPNVKGNDVLELDEKQCRSWMWLLHRLDG